jgi:hypothetical protein
MVVFLKSINSMYRKTRKLQSFLAGAIKAAKKKASKRGLFKSKRVMKTILPTVLSQHQDINVPVAPSGSI